MEDTKEESAFIAELDPKEAEKEEVEYDEDEDESADGDNNKGDGEDPLAEGEEPAPEPSCDKANSVSFFVLCKALENVWLAARKGKQVSDEQKLAAILPPKFLQSLRGESIFPIFRLLMPDKDGSRQFSMAENSIAVMYAGALELSRESRNYKKLEKYNNPHHVLQSEGQGDLSWVVRHVVEQTKPQKKSDWTVGQINEALDELSNLPSLARSLKSSHDWRSAAQQTSPNKKSSSNRKPPSLKELRIDWLKKVNRDGQKQGLSPVEHKWLVRILLRKLQFGVGWKKLLCWYHPLAGKLWDAHNSLKGICDKICSPEFSREAKEMDEVQRSREGKQPKGLDSYLAKSLVAPKFGIVFTPMLSERTGFARVLDDISHRHRTFVVSPEARKLVAPDCLAFQHPAFSVEPKLDGERMMCHIGRDGIVKMHTRRGNWYSELYSPVLGPPLRKAVREKFDIIMDGEVIAWDSERQETIPFGNNRTIAILRKKWMETQGLLDPRDSGMHDDDTQNKSMNASNTFFNNKSDEISELAGAECWLQFVLFDVLYVAGPGASDFLSRTVSECISPRPSAGSIIDLDGFERKKILYALIEPQKHQVELIKTWIIRPNGRTELGEEYFVPNKLRQECGYPPYISDSQNCTLHGSINELENNDIERRMGRTDEEISSARAHALQGLYNVMVEQQRIEGLVFKDLSTPYYLGEESKSRRYWLKFKPDYFNGSVASDLDLTIIGGYFATGLRHAGKPSGLLCACVDSKDPELYYPLTKVSLGSIDREQASELLKATGFWARKAGDEVGDDEDGRAEDKWFRGDKENKVIPEFVSSGSEGGGWRVQKKDYPDIWINPTDSVVVTLNAGEIVAADAFPAGLTLRFPRITKVRIGADSKDPWDIESERSLWELFRQVEESRSNTDAHATFQLGSPVKVSSSRPCRFLTEEQYAESRKKKKRAARSKRQHEGVAVQSAPETLASEALRGVSVTLLGREYRAAQGSIEIQEAVEQGWYDEAVKVRNAGSVVSFIKHHGGTYRITADEQCTFVLGGSVDDPQVVQHIQAIEKARSMVPSKSSKTKAAQKRLWIAGCPGVLRWTFLYSVVHRWLSSQATQDASIKDTQPELLRPTILDYLGRPASASSGPTYDDSLFEADLSSITTMRRALDLIEKTKNQAGENQKLQFSSWREECLNRLDVDGAWVAKCQRGSLPTGVVLYPDIYGERFGDAHVVDDSDRGRTKQVLNDPFSSMIESVLPLAQIMGASIASNLHSGVTHVLCNLHIGSDEIKYESDLSPRLFIDPDRGQKVLERLEDLDLGTASALDVMLVSPQWLRKRKWEGRP